MAPRKKKRNPRAAKKRRVTRSHAGARWPRRAGKKFSGSVSDPLYRAAFAAAMRAAGGGRKALPAPAGTPNVITVYAEPASAAEGTTMPRPRRKKVGRRFAGRVTDPLYRRAMADAAKVLKKRGKKKKKRRGKKRATPAQLRARKAFAARAKARARKARGKPRRVSTSRKPRAASRRPAAKRATSKKRRSNKKSKPLSKMAQVALRAARGQSTQGLSRSIGTERWLCRGPRRSGCGSTGRVVSGRGRFVRLR